RPVADQRHIPDEDIKELTNLIEAHIPEKLAEPRNTRIVYNLEVHRLGCIGTVLVELDQDLQLAVGAATHGTNLIEVEDPVSTSCPLGYVEDGAPRLQRDDEGNQQADRRQQEECRERDDDIKRALQAPQFDFRHRLGVFRFIRFVS